MAGGSYLRLLTARLDPTAALVKPPRSPLRRWEVGEAERFATPPPVAPRADRPEVELRALPARRVPRRADRRPARAIVQTSAAPAAPARPLPAREPAPPEGLPAREPAPAAAPLARLGSAPRDGKAVRVAPEPSRPAVEPSRPAVELAFRRGDEPRPFAADGSAPAAPPWAATQRAVPRALEPAGAPLRPPIAAARPARGHGPAAPEVHIGTIEVVVAESAARQATPPAGAAVAAAIPTPAAQPPRVRPARLARGFASTIGLDQG